MLWYDGGLAEGPVPFDLADRGLTLGDGVFDTALALDGRVAFAGAHLARLSAAAASLGLPDPRADARRAMTALAAAYPRAAIRTTLTRGSGPRGLAPPAAARPLLFASAAPLPPAPDTLSAPVRLHVTGIARNETSPTARLKTLNYLDAVLAAREARAAGCDEALFLNTRGDVACAGTANVFALFGRDLATPPLADGVLPGIVRAQVIRLAPSLGLEARERSLTRADLERADAVFLTNSLRLLSPVGAIGPRALPGGIAPDHAHAVLGALHARLAAACRDDDPEDGSVR